MPKTITRKEQDMPEAKQHQKSAQHYKVLVAFRPKEPVPRADSQNPFETEQDRIFTVGSLRQAQSLVQQHVAASAPELVWAGGDVWFGRMHIGRVRGDGTYVRGETGPVANNGTDPTMPSGSAGAHDRLTIIDPGPTGVEAVYALRDLLEQLSRAGIYEAGSARGRTPETSAIDFTRAERALGKGSTEA